MRITPADGNINAYVAVNSELDTNGDGSRLTHPASLHFNRITNYRNGDDTLWFSERTFGPEGSFGVIHHYLVSGLYQYNEFTGAPTATMVERGSTLSKLEAEVFTKIIMGAAPLSEFDTFVSQWSNAGGKTITEEVNAYYSENQ